MSIPAVGSGGMPRSRTQMAMEDMAIFSGDDSVQPMPTGRPGSAAGRRASTASNGSARFFGWRRGGGSRAGHHGGGGDDYDEEGGGGLDGGDLTPELSMNELSLLRDRDRYPTMGPAPGMPGTPGPGNGGRTMSITSTMSAGGFDTTPVIPTLGTATSSQKSYRANLQNSRKAALRTSDGVQYPGPIRPGGAGGPPMSPQMGASPRMSSGPPGMMRASMRMGGGPMGPGPHGGGRLPTMTGAPPSSEYFGQYGGGPAPGGPHGPAGGRTMSMGGYPPGYDPRMGPPMHPGGPNGHPNGMPPGAMGPGGVPRGPRVSGPPSRGLGKPMSNPSSNSSATMVDSSMNTDDEPKRLSRGSATGVAAVAPAPRASYADAEVQTDAVVVQSQSPTTSAYSDEAQSSPLSLSRDAATATTAPTSRSSMDSYGVGAGAGAAAGAAAVVGAGSMAAVASEKTQAQLDEATREVSELRSMNKTLLDEIRLVTGELADAIRRELGVSDVGEYVSPPSSPEDNSAGVNRRASLAPAQRAQKMVLLQTQLDLERRKRRLAEGRAPELANYDAAELEAQLAERERLLRNEQRETALLRDKITSMTSEMEELQLETSQLKNGILPELKSHVADLEVLTAAGNPIELLKEIEELKVENKKLQNLVNENSTRGPIGEKIKTVEGQRDALRTALRNLRERNDHEVRQATDRVRQLETKLERERLVNAQLQRKIAQTRSVSSPMSDSFKTHSSAASTSTLSDGGGATSQGTLAPPPAVQGPAGKRRAGAPSPIGIPPPIPGASSSRPSSPLPISFEISQEPAWVDYVDPSRLPQTHIRQHS